MNFTLLTFEMQFPEGCGYNSVETLKLNYHEKNRKQHFRNLHGTFRKSGCLQKVRESLREDGDGKPEVDWRKAGGAAGTAGGCRDSVQGGAGCRTERVLEPGGETAGVLRVQLVYQTKSAGFYGRRADWRFRQNRIDCRTTTIAGQYPLAARRRGR